MFFVRKTPTVMYLVRDSETGKYMGWSEEPSVYWDEDAAKRTIARQQGRRYEPKIQWKIVVVALP